MNTKNPDPERCPIPLPLPSPCLKSAHLELRRLEERHESRIQTLAADYEIAVATLSFPHPYPPGAAKSWMDKKRESFENGDELVVAIEEGGQLIGTMGLQLNRRDDSAELGYWIGKPYWGRGYATEAAVVMLSFGFEKLGLHRIQAQVMSRNPASGRVLEKIGMRHEGHLRGALKKWGVYEDVDIYAALAGTWRVGDSGP